MHTTLAFNKLVDYLKNDFPQYTFLEDSDFSWHYRSRTIIYSMSYNKYNPLSLLHEVAHAELDHNIYQLDIELVRKENAAWQYTKDNLAPKYGFKFNNAYVDNCMESYRIWLHKRSLCPNCAQTGLQYDKNTYNCLNCKCSWQVNDARKCGLRRTKVA